MLKFLLSGTYVDQLSDVNQKSPTIQHFERWNFLRHTIPTDVWGRNNGGRDIAQQFGLERNFVLKSTCGSVKRGLTSLVLVTITPFFPHPHVSIQGIE